ncbi:carbon-nitrogen hydrolase [Ophiobolus disseminans]|uniref:Carbon-nitrogen hydrolase n=1 Tax=Ophiobolus disseminans TaxID=1469910 RepID=A0A6A6ZK37_9PLEO|nr:carbon-nitrogen hydrolase [Ophiobolus disseminans]
MPSKIVKVAAVQAAPVAFNLEKNIQKLSKLTADAAASGADLIVIPEAFLSAYPWRYAFDTTIGAREPRGRKWYAKYYDGAISLSSPEFYALRAVAETNNVLLSVRIVEKDEVGGATLYCTSVLIARDGTLLSSHRKLIPTAAERLIWGRGAGDGLKVVDTELGEIGGLICWENYMPAARLALYQQDIEIYVAPHADDLPSWVASMQHIAKEGRCFVVSVNQFCRVSDFPEDYPPFAPESLDRQPDGTPWSSEAILNHG